MQKRIGLVIDDQGKPVSGATVKVTLYPGGGDATLYSDNGVTQKANPIATDSKGRYEYYAANGHYTEVVTTSAGAQPALNDIILDDTVASQSAVVASANNLVLSNAHRRFQISGATQINLIDATGWQGGDRITLHFQGAPTVKHNQAASGTNKPVMLSGAVDLAASANDQLTLQYDSTDSKWYELARTVI